VRYAVGPRRVNVLSYNIITGAMKTLVKVFGFVLGATGSVKLWTSGVPKNAQALQTCTYNYALLLKETAMSELEDVTYIDGVPFTTEQIQTLNKALTEKKKTYERAKRWRLANPERFKANALDYERHHRLTSRGHRLFGPNQVTKRPYPEDPIRCEVCRHVFDESDKRPLLYHHWNNEVPDWGIWVCTPCHKLCESIDSCPPKELEVLTTQYLALKQSINEECYAQI